MKKEFDKVIKLMREFNLSIQEIIERKNEFQLSPATVNVLEKKDGIIFYGHWDGM